MTPFDLVWPRVTSCGLAHDWQPVSRDYQVVAAEISATIGVRVGNLEDDAEAMGARVGNLEDAITAAVKDAVRNGTAVLIHLQLQTLTWA